MSLQDLLQKHKRSWETRPAEELKKRWIQALVDLIEVLRNLLAPLVADGLIRFEEHDHGDYVVKSGVKYINLLVPGKKPIYIRPRAYRGGFRTVGVELPGSQFSNADPEVPYSFVLGGPSGETWLIVKAHKPAPQYNRRAWFRKSVASIEPVAEWRDGEVRTLNRETVEAMLEELWNRTDMQIDKEIR